MCQKPKAQVWDLCWPDCNVPVIMIHCNGDESDRHSHANRPKEPRGKASAI